MDKFGMLLDRMDRFEKNLDKVETNLKEYMEEYLAQCQNNCSGKVGNLEKEIVRINKEEIVKIHEVDDRQDKAISGLNNFRWYLVGGLAATGFGLKILGVL